MTFHRSAGDVTTGVVWDYLRLGAERRQQGYPTPPILQAGLSNTRIGAASLELVYSANHSLLSGFFLNRVPVTGLRRGPVGEVQTPDKIPGLRYYGVQESLD